MRPLPAWLTVAAPKATRQLAFYGDSSLAVLGPSGWGCRPPIATDAGQSVRVTPRPVASPSEQTDTVVAASDASACQGCIAVLACPFFPKASAIYGMPCPRAVPPWERVVRSSTTAFAFADPQF